MTDQISYRVGRSWGVTVVREQTGRPDQLVGTMQTREDAQLIVEALNGRQEMALKLKLAEEILREYEYGTEYNGYDETGGAGSALYDIAVALGLEQP